MQQFYKIEEIDLRWLLILDILQIISWKRLDLPAAAAHFTYQDTCCKFVSCALAKLLVTLHVVL
ncbi:hypothetical protein CFP56_043467 [Quercus suber]|uniref:Uncharacterized protein n=1 Tax=Quercus suber TaxID=58331 RepID=A0AAW0LJ28_QUESU